jgi:hypothetical protein
VSYQIIFLIIENQQFRGLIVLYFVNLVAYLPSNDNIIRRWIMDSFEIRKAAMIADLQLNINSAVHVFFVLWISSNSLAFIAVIIYYIDKRYKNRTRLIAMRRVYGNHFREYQTELLIEVFKEYELINRLEYFI